MNVTPQDLKGAAAQLYGAQLTGAEPLGNSANLVCAAESGGEPLILRASAHSQAREAHIAFELDWLDYLARRMEGVAGPIRSVGGNLYEVVPGAQGPMVLCAFDRAPGALPDPGDPARWNDALFRGMGELMGRMHRATRDYMAGRELSDAPVWHRDFLAEPDYAATMDEDVRTVHQRLLREMDALPVGPGDWGIIHADVHHQNFHVADGAITLFDFDDCGAGWYVCDVASTLFFSINTVDYRDTAARRDFARRFGSAFLAGYRDALDLPSPWLEQLDLFLRFRRLNLYRFIRHLFGDGADHPYADYAAHLRDAILADTPFVDLDWASIL